MAPYYSVDNADDKWCHVGMVTNSEGALTSDPIPVGYHEFMLEFEYDKQNNGDVLTVNIKTIETSDAFSFDSE